MFPTPIVHDGLLALGIFPPLRLHGAFAGGMPSGMDYAELGRGLQKGIYNYMHGIGLEIDVRRWFDLRVTRSKMPRDSIAQALSGISRP